MRVPFRDWLWQMWPTHTLRYAVCADYATIGAQHKHFLADVALRGGVYRAFDQRSDGDLANFNGRRELALEIIKLAKVDPDQLFASIPTKPREEKSS